MTCWDFATGKYSWLLVLWILSREVVGQIRGVNLGGWLIIEEWITPTLFRETPHANDEWHLCAQLGRDSCLSTLNDHWNTFYTLDDFQAIHAAGLNTVRIPIGYWAVDLNTAIEPYVSGQFPYLIRAVQWAQQLGLQVVLDLHGAPGSQNGQDNSGLIGPVLFPTNASNSDRSLNVLQNFTEEFAQGGIYGDTVIGIELLNEPRLSPDVFSMAQLQEFYAQGADVVSGVDAGMNVTIHDAFYGPAYWAGYSPYTNNSGASQPVSHLTLDTHQYYAFAPLNNLSHSEILSSVCTISALLKQRKSISGIPYTVVGEWSLETASSNDYQGTGDSQAERTWLRLLFEAQHAAYSPNGAGQSALGWIFWSWKTEYDIDTWSYRNGIAQEYIPADISNASQLAFPVLQSGCVDASYNYTAPLTVGGASKDGVVGWRMFGLALMTVVVVMMGPWA